MNKNFDPGANQLFRVSRGRVWMVRRRLQRRSRAEGASARWVERWRRLRRPAWPAWPAWRAACGSRKAPRGPISSSTICRKSSETTTWRRPSRRSVTSSRPKCSSISRRTSPSVLVSGISWVYQFHLPGSWKANAISNLLQVSYHTTTPWVRRQPSKPWTVSRSAPSASKFSWNVPKMPPNPTENKQTQLLNTKL